MSKTVKIVLGIIVLAVLIILIVSSKKTETGPIKIGFIAPLTGEAAAYGEPIKRGTEIAVSEINEKGGIKGRKIEVVYEDGKCSNKDATSAAQKLISIDKVKVIVGMICSGELLSAAPVAENAKVVLIGQGSSPDITKAGDYTFRTFPSDTIVGTTLVQSMEKNGVKTVAILTGSTAYTLALQKDFESKVKNSTVKLVATETYTENTKDFRSLLQKIKAANPDAILIDTQTGAEAGRVAQQARDLGLKSQFYSAYFTGTEFTGLGKVVEGTYIVDAPSLVEGDERVAAFLKKSKEKYGSDQTYPFFAANVYDEIYLLADIISKVGYDDAEKIKNALYAVKDFDGLSGKFGFDENGDVTGIGMRLTQVKDGKVVPVN